MGLFKMPSLGADMEAGTLVEWLVRPGDRIARGQIVAVVETQKGAIEVECFEEGVLEELLVAPGAKVPVDTPLARIRGAGEPAGAQPARVAPSPTAQAGAAAATPGEAQAPRPPESPLPSAAEPPAAPVRAAPRDLKVSPAARRRALELGVPLDRLQGSGPEGAITVADVEAAAREARPPGPAPATAPLPAPAPAETPEAVKPAAQRGFDPLAMRKAIAAAMSRSKREIPHYYLESTVEMGPALAFLERVNRDRPPTERLLPAVLLLKAAALALREVPELNGFWLEDGFRPGPAIHLGWAIALRGGGLVAPAIHDADRCSLDDLMAALRDLVQRARLGGLRSSELGEATITVTSLGERGAETVLPVIYPPQVAILGIGRIVERPWVENGAVAVRSVVTLGLAADHRVSDGHRGGLLLAAIERHLEREDLP